MTITDQAKTVWASGPSTAPYEPDKYQIIALFQMIDSTLSSALNGTLVGNAVVYATRSALYADLAHPANRLGVVYNDPTAGYNGIYIKSGSSGSGSWSITSLALPSTFAADLSAVIAEVATARGAEASLVARLNAIVGIIASSTTPVMDFGRELLYDHTGAVGPALTLYIPRELFVQFAGSEVRNGNFGTASTPFPNHVAFTASSGSSVATVYVDMTDGTNPVKIATSPSGVPQTTAGRYLIVAEIFRGVVKSQFPVLRLDENLKSRVQMRFPIMVTGDKIRIPSFYRFTVRDGFTQYAPSSNDFYWEFDLPTSTTLETRYYFDPTDADNPVKAVSSTTAPTFPRDDRLVMIASAIGRVVKTDHLIIGARPGSRELSFFTRGNDPDHAALFSANSTPADISGSNLNALGITRGVTGTEAYYGEDLPADMPLEGWYFVRCYVQASVADTFYTPRLYFLTAAGAALTTEGGATSYFSMIREVQLSNTERVYFGFGRYKFTDQPARFNIGCDQSTNQCTFGGAQLYAGKNFGACVFAQEWPVPEEMDALYGPKHYAIAGRVVPFFTQSMLAGKRDGERQPRLTVRSSAATDAGIPYMISSQGSFELDYSRATSPMLFETQGGKEGAIRRARREVAIVRSAGPYVGSPVILGIGDSVTNRSNLNKVEAKLEAVGLTPTFIGTILQQGGVYGEGRESWEWQDWYYGDTTYPAVTDVPAYLALAADGTGSDRRQGHNPWVRPATGGDPVGKVFNGHIFDFGWGLSRLGLATPTHVPINLGTNDINQRDPATSLAQAKKGLEILVPSIRAAGANIEIGIGLHNVPRASLPDRKWFEEQVPMIRAIIDYVKTLGDSKVNVLPYWAHMSVDTGWPENDLYEIENMKVVRASDDLHPSDDNRHFMAEVTAAWVANTL